MSQDRIWSRRGSKWGCASADFTAALAAAKRSLCETDGEFISTKLDGIDLSLFFKACLVIWSKSLILQSNPFSSYMCAHPASSSAESNWPPSSFIRQSACNTKEASSFRAVDEPGCLSMYLKSCDLWPRLRRQAIPILSTIQARRTGLYPGITSLHHWTWWWTDYRCGT